VWRDAGAEEGADEVRENTGGVVSTSGVGPPLVATRRRRLIRRNTTRTMAATTLQEIETMIGAKELDAKPMARVTAATRTKPMVTKSSTKSPSELAGQDTQRTGA
jgi:hypothetical protein